jgi:hypothetical protein
MKGGDLYERKPKEKKQKAIPKESPKRKVEKKRYAENCAELTEELRQQNGGKIYCFFSGEEIFAKKPPYHHLRKRTGKFYTDKEWLVPNINEYHLDYHFKPIEWLLQQKWYTQVFLPNLRAKSEELYRKELKRQDKAGLFDEEIDF